MTKHTKFTIQIFLLLAMFTMSFSLGGCMGNPGETVPDSYQETQSNVSESARSTVAVVHKASAETIFSEEAEDSGFSLYFTSTESAQEQMKAVRAYFRQGVDIIGLCPAADDSWETVLKEAQYVGIPVILLEQTAGISENLYTALIEESDEKNEGNQATDQPSLVESFFSACQTLTAGESIEKHSFQ